MHSDFDFEDWIYREINIQVFSKDYGTMIFGLLDLVWKWSIHFSFLVMQMTLPKRHILLWIWDTYVFVTLYLICKETCMDCAFSSVYLSVLNIICFLLAVLHPYFVCFWELLLFLFKAFSGKGYSDVCAVVGSVRGLLNRCWFSL